MVVGLIMMKVLKMENGYSCMIILKGYNDIIIRYIDVLCKGVY